MITRRRLEQIAAIPDDQIDLSDQPEVTAEQFARARLKVPGQMCVFNTPLEHYPEMGLWVKREDLCCPGGPNFSKTRGVYARVASRPEKIIGVLDTAHSQGGWAVAKACALLKKECVLYYPVRASEAFDSLKPQQEAARALGANLVEMRAGRSFVLYNRAKKLLPKGSYMMPNALKLFESVEETAAEFKRTPIPKVETILVSASSGTIAAGVLRGAAQQGWRGRMIVHLGYSRPEAAMRRYVVSCAGAVFKGLEFVDEGYSYADESKPIGLPPFPCSKFYDLKALRWWIEAGRARHGEALFWNIG